MKITAETIMYLLANILRVYSCKKLVTSFLPDKKLVSRAIENTGYICYYILNSVCYLYFDIPVINILTNIIPLICLCYCRQTRFTSNLAAASMTFAVAMLSETLLCVFFNTSIVFSSGIATGFLLFLIALLAEHFYRKRPSYKISIPLLTGIIVLPASSIVIGALTISKYTVTSAAEAALLILINIAAFYLYGELGDMYEEKEKNLIIHQQDRIYNEQLKAAAQADEQLSFFRHDMKNHFLQLRSLANDKHNGGLEKYIDRCLEALNVRPGYVMTNNPEIDSVINYKLSEAEQINAKITTDIKLPEGLQIDCFDWNIILGNLLDNAIDALRLCDKKMLSLSIYYDCGTLCIRLENTCKNSPEFVNGEPQPKNGKCGESHGIGLKSVRNILKKYNGSMELSYEDGMFTTSVFIYLKGSD